MMKLLLLSLSLSLMIYYSNFFKMINHSIMFMLMFIYLNKLNFKYFYWSKIYYKFGLDNISFMLMILTIWILSLSLMSNMMFIKNKNFNFMIMTMLMMFILCFSSMNMMFFFIFFECSLLPMLILILGWGSQIDRIQASMYMIFYTFFGSLPLLVMLIFINNTLNSISLPFLTLWNLNYLNNLLIYMMLMLAFLIKLPMYYTHMWLPKAHVQAPISGSMILAGIMLKLGSYGIYRMILIFNLMNMKFNYLILSLSLIGSIYASLICMNKIDMKIIIAYSSIVHMNMMLASLVTLNMWSFIGSFWMMLAHGMTSSGMFCLVNFNYERLKSRNLFMNKGMMNIFPSMSIWWFLMMSSNFSAPLSLNLFSEIFMINSLVMFSYYNLMFILIITFSSTCYSIYLFSMSQHGNFVKSIFMKLMNMREFLIILLHWVPLNTMFLNLFMI